MTTCNSCGKKTNQPITDIIRKGLPHRRDLPICRECYDKYRSRWDNEETERICRSTRKTKNGGKSAKMPKRKRKIAPMCVYYERSGTWCGYGIGPGGKKIRVPGARTATQEKTARVVLNYCRKNGSIDEEQAERYCKERGLPYSRPQAKEVA